MRKSNYLLVSIIVASLVGVTSCNECRKEQEITYEKFLEVYYGWLGFEGHESISFLKNGKDTVSFNGTGLQVYYEYIERPNGNCEANYKLLNHKVTFNNKEEGNIILHYFKNSQYNSDAFEIMFNSTPILKPTSVNILSELPYDSTTVVLGRKCKQGRGFSTNNKDSIYIDGYTEAPRYRIMRMKLNSNIYELIP